MWNTSVALCASAPQAAQCLAHPRWKNTITETQQEHLCQQAHPFQQQHRAGIHLAIGSASRKPRSWVTKKPARPPSLPELWGPGPCEFHPSFLEAWTRRAVTEKWKKHTHTHTYTPHADLSSRLRRSLYLPWRVCPVDAMPRLASRRTFWWVETN